MNTISSAALLTFIAFLLSLFIYRSRTILQRVTYEMPANAGRPKALYTSIQIALLSISLALLFDLFVLLRMKGKVRSLSSQNPNLRYTRGDVVRVTPFLLLP